MHSSINLSNAFIFAQRKRLHYLRIQSLRKFSEFRLLTILLIGMSCFGSLQKLPVQPYNFIFHLSLA